MANPTIEIDPELKAKVEFLMDSRKRTMSDALGICYITLKKSVVSASMPVNENTKQPFGILHGGASVALAESLASIGAWLNIDERAFNAVGIEINANHIKAVSDGVVIGTSVPLHIGRSTHVWETKIVTGDSKLVCVSRCTLAIVAKK